VVTHNDSVIRYLDWAETVLRAALVDRPASEPLTLSKLADAVGLSYAGLPERDGNAVIMCLDHVLVDLARHGLVIYSSSNWTVGYPPAARRYRRESLARAWSELRSGYLSTDDEAFLSALAELSEQPGTDRADVNDVDAEDVFAALAWDWDGLRAEAIFRHLRDRHYIEGNMMAGPSIYLRVTYAGLVRAFDDAGNLLREAEDHLQVGRLRAAGCVAAVELERRLKLLVDGLQIEVRKRDPGIEDYNQAAYKARRIDQESWQSNTALAVIRKQCVHVLDREPKEDEVRRLIDGVERFLRRYPEP
jgi:hypothetical protein